MSRSDSPYTRHGEPITTTEPSNIVYPLTHGYRENPLLVAHLTLGEWRYWRLLLEETDIENPFDMGEFDGGDYPAVTEVLAPRQYLGVGGGR